MIIQYDGICKHCFIIQIDPNARITSPTSTTVCSAISYSLGVVDPLVYLFFQKKYRFEIMMLLKRLFCMDRSADIDPDRTTLGQTFRTSTTVRQTFRTKY